MSSHDQVALWLYRRFKSSKTIVFDEKKEETKEIDRFEPVGMLKNSLQGYTGKMMDHQSRTYKCVKAASKWHIQEGLSLGEGPIKEDFLAERDLLRRLTEMDDCHSSICKYITSWECPLQFYYAMEYSPNGSLLDFANHKLHSRGRPISNTLRLKVVSRIMSRIVEGLAWLHSKSILHMDLSLENILMANTDPLWPKIKIIDFGVALDFSGQEKPGPLERVEWTHDQWVGKPAYRVLEVARNLNEIVEKRGYRIPYDAKAADIGTLGSILFMLIRGKYPPNELQSVSYGGRLREWIYLARLESRFDLDSFDLLNRLWISEEKRITMNELIEHPFITRGRITHHESRQRRRPSRSSMISTDESSEGVQENDDTSCHPPPLNTSVSLPILSRHNIPQEGLQMID